MQVVIAIQSWTFGSGPEGPELEGYSNSTVVGKQKIPFCWIESPLYQNFPHTPTQAGTRTKIFGETKARKPKRHYLSSVYNLSSYQAPPHESGTSVTEQA